MVDESSSSFNIVAFGIPSLDYVIQTNTTELFEKYKTMPDGEIALTRDRLNNIQQELLEHKYRGKYRPGGNSILSLLVYQKLGAESCKNIFMGAVGTDKEGVFMTNTLNEEGISSACDKLQGTTGFCIIFAHKRGRSVLASNGVGENYTLENFTEIERKKGIVKMANVVLFEGFFLLYSNDIYKSIMKCCKQNGIIICINLSSKYVVEKASRNVINATRIADIIIGNRGEFETLCHYLKLKYNKEGKMENMVKACQKWLLESYVQNPAVEPKVKILSNYKKILIITNRDEPVYCAYGNNEFVVYEPIHIEENQITNTVGAGDSFLGGFLFGFLRGNSITQCLEIAGNAAINYIQRKNNLCPIEKDEI